MSWQTQLKSASFNGVKFQVDSFTTTAGLDNIIRDYPFQDLPIIQSMGEATNEYQLSCYVVGDKYYKKRDKLAKALRGKGTLIHPIYGHLEVWVKGTFTIKENIVNGLGIARFEISFIKAEAQSYPKSENNLRIKALNGVADAIDKSAEQVAKYFSILGPDFLKTTAIGQIDEIIDSLDNWMNAFGTTADNIIASKQYLDSVKSNFNNLLKSPERLFAKFAKLTNMISPNTGTYVSSYVNSNILAERGLNRVSSPAQSPFATPATKQQATNTKALQDFNAVQSVALNSKLALNQQFNTTDDLTNAIKQLNTSFNKLIANDNYTISNLITNLQASVLNYLRKQKTKSILIYTPVQTESVWIVSYKVVGNTKSADAIYQSNPHIKHPMLASANQQINVAING